MSGPFGADVDPRPPRCGCCGHPGIAHLRLGAAGSVICVGCPGMACQPPGPGGEVDEGELDELIGRAQRLLADWHRNRRG